MFLRFPALWALAAVALLGIGGCSHEAGVTLRSLGEPVELRGPMRLIAYSSDDPNSADIYLTDLPPAALDPGADLRGLSGQVVHLHLFLTPKAGSTPIASDASTVTIRHVVVASGEIGMYGGGGFLNPSGKPGDDELSASLTGGSCRLLTSTPGFQDRLGLCTFSADFRVPKNDEIASLIEARMTSILAKLPAADVPLPRRSGEKGGAAGL